MLLLLAAPIALVPDFFLTAPDGAAGDAFGERIALTQRHIVVAAPGRGQGALYVFDRATQAFARRIDAPSGSGPEFPSSLAAGPGEIVVAGDFRGGTAHLFDVASGTRTRQLEPAGDIRNGWGATVVADADRFVVFNLFEDNAKGWAGGTAYFFAAPTGDFLYALDQPIETTQNFSWGNSACLAGDTMLVGNIYGRSVPGPGAGEVHEVDLATGTVTAVYPDATNGQNLLGSGVQFSPDGTEILALPGYDDGFPYGWAYVYPRGNPAPRLRIQSPSLASGQGNEYFGRSALWIGNEILFGAPRARVEGNNAVGKVYRASADDGATLGELLAPDPAPAAGRGFGAAIARDEQYVYIGAGIDFGQPGRIYAYRLQPSFEGWMIH